MRSVRRSFHLFTGRLPKGETVLMTRVGYVDYSMAQASRAILPRDSGGRLTHAFHTDCLESQALELILMLCVLFTGPWGKRIGVTVGGTLNWALRVG